MDENDSSIYSVSGSENVTEAECFWFNDTTDENLTALARNYIYSDLDAVFHIVVLPVILLIGIITNCAFLFVVYRIPSMRTVVNQYLTHIAIGDLLFLITAIGKKILKFSSSKNKFDSGAFWGHWIEVCCHTVNYTTIFASVLIMTLVGFERFYAVCRPMRIYAATTNQRMVKILLSIVWTLSAALALTTIPAIIQVRVYCVYWPTTPEFEGLDEKFATYFSYSNAALAYTSLVQTVPFFVVMGINSVLYAKMISTMSWRLGTMQAHDLDTHNNVELRNKVAIMLIINGVTFFTLTFPFQFVSFINGILTLCNETQLLGAKCKTFFQILLYCNSLINPIIYNAANSRYRSAFKTAFGIDKFDCIGYGCTIGSQQYNAPLNNGNVKESPTKNTITTTYSNNYTTNANGDILLESDTKC